MSGSQIFQDYCQFFEHEFTALPSSAAFCRLIPPVSAHRPPPG